MVNENSEVFKVPFSIKKVSGSFTGQALYTELIKEICSIKKLQGNASENIRTLIEKKTESISKT